MSRKKRRNCVRHHWKSWTTKALDTGGEIVVCPWCGPITKPVKP